MRIALQILVYAMVSAALLNSCKRSRYHPDISGIEVKVSIKRLEKDLFSYDPVKLPDTVNYIIRNYGSFLQYFSYVINIGKVGDTSWSGGLLKFCTDRLNNEVYENTIQVFPDLNWLEKELSTAFKHYRYYFPARPVPEIYTCITGFNNSIITGDSVLGIGLDRYLGSDCRFYPRLGIYRYQMAKMTPDYIVTDCMYAWAASEWDYNTSGYNPDNALSAIIHEGKLMYFVKCMVPRKPDSVIFGFNESQMRFCTENEGAMWQYLIENDLLFNTDMFTRKKLVGEAPFTSYFSQESPGRAAVWIGFRIVESYMIQNRGTDLEMLMNINDPQEILAKARYSPRVY